jgi:hypothetical protein
MIGIVHHDDEISHRVAETTTHDFIFLSRFRGRRLHDVLFVLWQNVRKISKGQTLEVVNI